MDDAGFIELVNQDSGDYNDGIDGWSTVQFDGETLAVYFTPRVGEENHVRVWRVVA